MAWFGRKKVSPFVEARDEILRIYGVTTPTDAQKFRAAFYLCLAAMAILNAAGAENRRIEQLVHDAHDLVRDLRFKVDELLEHDKDPMPDILRQLPQGAGPSMRLNGTAAWDLLYTMIGEAVMRDIWSHRDGPTSVFGYSAIVVVDGVLGRGRSREHFLPICDVMTTFAQRLV